MKFAIYWSTLFASIAFFGNQAIGQTLQDTSPVGDRTVQPLANPAVPPAVSQPASPPDTQTPPVDRSAPDAQIPAQNPTQSSPATLQCPAGYFASAFSDVTPDHWAYEAVNRLAGVEPRCFPIAS